MPRSLVWKLDELIIVFFKWLLFIVEIGVTFVLQFDYVAKLQIKFVLQNNFTTFFQKNALFFEKNFNVLKISEIKLKKILRFFCYKCYKSDFCV